MRLPIATVALAVFVHTLWGANPVAVKFGLLVFPPFWSGFVRFALGIACIAVWAGFARVRLWPSGHEWRGLLLLSALFYVQISFMNFGYNLTSGQVASVLTSTYPMFAAVFAHLMLNDDRLTIAKSTGLSIAFLGVGLILTRDIDLATMTWLGWGAMVVLFNAAMLGFRMIYSAQLLRNIDPVRVMSWQMILSLPAFAVSGMIFETIQWQNLDWPPLLGLAYQGIVIAGFGFMINAELMKRHSPSLMTSFGFVGPVSGVLLSLWLLSESLSWQVAIGTVTVAIGLFVITRR